jgi:hypothetical protein
MRQAGMMNEQHLSAEATPISDEEATIRLKQYNRDGVLGRALNYAWLMAGPIIIDTHHQVGAELVRRAKAATSQEELARFQVDNVLKDSLQSVQDRFKLPVDLDWVRRIAASAVAFHSLSIPSASIVKGKVEVARRTVIRIHDEFSDNEIAVQVANTVWTLLAFETEILAWKFGELRRAG